MPRLNDLVLPADRLRVHFTGVVALVPRRWTNLNVEVACAPGFMRELLQALDCISWQVLVLFMA